MKKLATAFGITALMVSAMGYAAERVTHNMAVVSKISNDTNLIVNAGSHDQVRSNLYAGTEIFWGQLQNKSGTIVNEPAIGFHPTGKLTFDENTKLLSICASNIDNCDNPLTLEFVATDYTYFKLINNSPVFKYNKSLNPGDSSAMTFLKKANNGNVDIGSYEITYEAWILNE